VKRLIAVIFVAALSVSALAQGLSSPATGKALIYVYRPTTTWGPKWPVHVFVNGELLGALPSSSYVASEVAPGSLVFTAPDTANQHIKGLSISGHWSFPPTLRWPKCEGTPRKATCTWDAAVQSAEKEDYGCGKVDWRRAGEARREDVAQCEDALSETLAALANWFGTPPNRPGVLVPFVGVGPGLMPGPITPFILPYSGGGPTGNSVWLQMCGPNPLPKPSSPEAGNIRRDVMSGNYTNDWSRCQHEAAEAYITLQSQERLRIEVEAGKTYYVRWIGKKMELVDAPKGTKEISGLQPLQLAKD
jgi:hypothetical protein